MLNDLNEASQEVGLAMNLRKIMIMKIEYVNEEDHDQTTITVNDTVTDVTGHYIYQLAEFCIKGTRDQLSNHHGLKGFRKSQFRIQRQEYGSCAEKNL